MRVKLTGFTVGLRIFAGLKRYGAETLTPKP